MAADDQVWQAWWFAANNEQDYAVSDKERTNKTKFSAYILKVKCSTEENKDGCCFKSKSKGANCIIADSGEATGAATYRIKEADWTTAIAAFATNQASHVDSFSSSKVATNDPTVAMEWLDYAKCATTAGSPNVHECGIYQPDWADDDDETDGYPRWGITSVDNTAGFIDASATSALVMEAITF